MKLWRALRWRLWLTTATLVAMATPILTVISFVVGLGFLPGAKEILPPEAKSHHLCIFLVATFGAISGWLSLGKLEENQPVCAP